jgi:hypothetical protein
MKFSILSREIKFFFNNSTNFPGVAIIKSISSFSFIVIFPPVITLDFIFIYLVNLFIYLFICSVNSFVGTNINILFFFFF